MSKRKDKSAKRSALAVSDTKIDRSILLVRGQRVMLDSDLAGLYGVSTTALNQAVKRNVDWFPEDFAFQLSVQEFKNLKSQTVTSSWGGRRVPPWAFTEHGVAMLSSVLRSPLTKASADLTPIPFAILGPSASRPHPNRAPKPNRGARVVDGAERGMLLAVSLRERDRHILLRGLRKRSQSPGVDVAAPGAGGGAGEFEDFGAGPCGRA